MRARFLAKMYFFLIKKSLVDVEVVEEKAGKRGCQRLPAFLWPIRDETKGQRRGERTCFFIAVVAVHFGDLGEILIVFWTRKGKSLNFIQLFSMFRE